MDIQKTVEQIADLQKDFQHYDNEVAQASYVKRELEQKRESVRKMLEHKMHMLDKMLRDGDTSLYIDRQEIGAYTVKVRKQPRSVICDDPQALPMQYHKLKVEADKKALKRDLEEGIEIDGASLSEEEYKLYVE